MRDDLTIRISIARQSLDTLPTGETRAYLALAVLDRFARGEATHQQLVHAGDACRRGFHAYAKQAKREMNPAAKARCKAWCVAMFSVYDAIDRVVDDRAVVTMHPEETVLSAIWRILVGWLRTPRALPRHPDADFPYRTTGDKEAA